MLDGTLGVYPQKKFHIEIEPDAKPTFSYPYLCHATFKKELDHLVSLGVLVPQEASEWTSSTFITPKKDGRVCWVGNLRQLNKVVKRRQYPLPIITDILQKCMGFEFFTKLDISMQYYTFELDEENQDLCTINTAFGLTLNSQWDSNALQASPKRPWRTYYVCGIKDADVYIDDVGAFSDDWDSHVIKLLREILRQLREDSFTINPLKYKWAVKESDWLSYWLTSRGLKPWKKKIDAVLRMERPQDATALQAFIGVVNFYRDM
ncbi:LOW QUALITY PROTEIN: hypothetical protein ACHAWF_014410 [Thalassiosira exigua]